MKGTFVVSGSDAAARQFAPFAQALAVALREFRIEAVCFDLTSECGGSEEVTRSDLKSLLNREFANNSSSAQFSSSDLDAWAFRLGETLRADVAHSILERQLAASPPNFVFLRWQAGLIDAAGHRTALAHRLEAISRRGESTVLVFADSVHPPILSSLAAAGVCFYAPSAAIASQLLDIGISQAAILEHSSDGLVGRFAKALREFSLPGAADRRRKAWSRGRDEKRVERANLLFSHGKHADAINILGEMLAHHETSDRWNDWATFHLAVENREEAEAGFRRALELNPGNIAVTAKLGLLLALQEKRRAAIPLLERALSSPAMEDRRVLESVLAQCRLACDPGSSPSRETLRTYLGCFCGTDSNERSYFLTHLERYLATLELLPEAFPGQRLLELGAAFHHLTPALAHWKHYSEVRCADLWEGDSQCVRRVVNCDRSEEHAFIVDNFDVHSPTWPYTDSSFDVVLFCEMLEHLICDPMKVMSEINRILKPGGLLLLTTPNMAGARNVSSILRRDTPYAWGQYEIDGRPTDHHNREYTPGEVERLAAAAGLAVVEMQTPDIWGTHRDALPRLAAAGFPMAKRGDAIFLLARKAGPITCRYPSEFYLERGTQQNRRDAQATTSNDQNRPATHDPYLPLRVLVIHEHLPWIGQGGSEVRLMQILRELRAQGHAVSFLAVVPKSA